MSSHTRKTSLWVRNDLFTKGKVLASIRGTTFSDILNKALEEYLKSHEDELKKRVTEIVTK